MHDTSLLPVGPDEETAGNEKLSPRGPETAGGLVRDKIVVRKTTNVRS